MPYDYEEEMAQGPVIMPAPQVRAFNIKDWFGNLVAESGKFDWSYGFHEFLFSYNFNVEITLLEAKNYNVWDSQKSF